VTNLSFICEKNQVLKITTNGVPFVLSYVPTDRPQRYFPQDLDPKKCVPIALFQRGARGMLPPTIEDPFGNLVVVHVTSQGQAITFSYSKEKLFQEITKVANNL